MATKTKAKSADKPKEDGRAALMEKYISEIDRFAGSLREQQDKIRDLEKEVAVARTVFDEAKDSLREAKDVEHSTVSLLLKFIRPGSLEIMPLFDTMEPAEEEVHGLNADEWRQEPIVALDLSSAAMRALIEAEVVLVGQLQDRILKGDTWAEGITGITDGMAQAIEAKLQQFIEGRSRKKT